jgi:hypothetical protein
MVRWTQQRDDTLVAGIELLPGRWQPVAVRRTGVLATPDTYQRAFLLPEATEGHAATLILPPGYGKPERIVEVWTPMATRRFKLLAVLDRGADFESAGATELT